MSTRDETSNPPEPPAGLAPVKLVFSSDWVEEEETETEEAVAGIFLSPNEVRICIQPLQAAADFDGDTEAEVTAVDLEARLDALEGS